MKTTTIQPGYKVMLAAENIKDATKQIDLTATRLARQGEAPETVEKAIQRRHRELWDTIQQAFAGLPPRSRWTLYGLMKEAAVLRPKNPSGALYESPHKSTRRKTA